MANLQSSCKFIINKHNYYQNPKSFTFISKKSIFPFSSTAVIRSFPLNKSATIPIVQPIPQTIPFEIATDFNDWKPTFVITFLPSDPAIFFPELIAIAYAPSPTYSKAFFVKIFLATN